jgi:hypothetical protein
MGTKTAKTPTEKLRLIGKLQLSSYLFLLFWMTTWEAIAIQARLKEYPAIEGQYPWMWMWFSPLGLLLIPSAITFIQTGKKPNSPSTRSARILQTILFCIVLLLTYPALALMSALWTHGVLPDVYSYLTLPSFFVACVLGIASFPIMWKITNSLVPKRIALEGDGNLDLIKR